MIFDKDDPDFGDMQNVKRRMFALRNGVVAEALRRGGCPYRIVFGLTLPQLDEVASVTPHTVTVAQMLWDNDSTRESRLLAPMICPREGMTVDRARRWLGQCRSTEDVDILCHRLLRHLPWASMLVDELSGREDADLMRYAAVRLAFNLVYKDAAMGLRVALAEERRECPLTRHVASMLADEARFVLNPGD